MRLRYLERNAATREALEILDGAARLEECIGGLALRFRDGSRPRYLGTVEELLDIAAEVAAGLPFDQIGRGRAWRMRRWFNGAPHRTARHSRRTVLASAPAAEATAPAGSDPELYLELVRTIDHWRSRAIAAEAALPASDDADERYQALRRHVARTLHPDGVPETSPEHAVRTELFQRVWSAVEELDDKG